MSVEGGLTPLGRRRREARLQHEEAWGGMGLAEALTGFPTISSHGAHVEATSSVDIRNSRARVTANRSMATDRIRGSRQGIARVSPLTPGRETEQERLIATPPKEISSGPIEILKLLKKVVIRDKVPPDECAICLQAYAPGQILRRYTCPGKHMYHQGPSVYTLTLIPILTPILTLALTQECLWAWIKRDIRCPACRWDPTLAIHRYG